MPKGMKGYEHQKDGGYSKYDPKSATVKKHGGNKAVHDGVMSGGSKYPTPRAGASKMAKGMTG